MCDPSQRPLGSTATARQEVVVPVRRPDTIPGLETSTPPQLELLQGGADATTVEEAQDTAAEAKDAAIEAGLTGDRGETAEAITVVTTPPAPQAARDKPGTLGKKGAAEMDVPKGKAEPTAPTTTKAVVVSLPSGPQPSKSGAERGRGRIEGKPRKRRRRGTKPGRERPHPTTTKPQPPRRTPEPGPRPTTGKSSATAPRESLGKRLLKKVGLGGGGEKAKEAASHPNKKKILRALETACAKEGDFRGASKKEKKKLKNPRIAWQTTVVRELDVLAGGELGEVVLKGATMRERREILVGLKTRVLAIIGEENADKFPNFLKSAN